MVVKMSESSKNSNKFILYRGFPLRYLARMEPSHEKPIMFVFKHECSNEFEAEGELTIQQEQAQLTYLPPDNGKNKLLVEVSKFVYVFQEVVHQFFTQLFVLHFFLDFLISFRNIPIDVFMRFGRSLGHETSLGVLGIT